MQNFIMNMPQTLILFKITSGILAVQKYLEGDVIDGLNWLLPPNIFSQLRSQK